MNPFTAICVCLTLKMVSPSLPQPGSPGYSAPSGGPGGTPSLRDQLKATAKSTLQQAAQSEEFAS